MVMEQEHQAGSHAEPQSQPDPDADSPAPASSSFAPLTAREQRLAQQIDTTRARCTQLLGPELFRRVYDYVKKLGSLEGDLLESAAQQRALDLETVVRGWLKPDQLPALTLIQKLIYCEDLFYSE